jgi:hypothetical protein
MSVQIAIQDAQKHPLILSIICSISSWLIANAEAAEIATTWFKLLGAALTAISGTIFLVRFLMKWYRSGKFIL